VKENIDKLPLKEVKKKVMYHDPCHLGRKFEYYDIPREIIEAVPGIELIAFEKEKQDAQCCGAGGGVKSAKPDIANNLAKQKMDEAKEKGADMVVSACPFCELNLNDNCEEIPVVDILNLLMESLGEVKE
jgi:Fe-S oxidoreductase